MPPLFRRLLGLIMLMLMLGCPADSGDHDFDGDGWEDDVDCEPDDPDSYPNATEDCNDGVDNDCDGFVDSLDGDCSGDDDTGDDDTTGIPADDDSAMQDDDDSSGDEDDDGDGFTPNQGDCNDNDPDVNPEAYDDCDDIDNDCDGRINDDVTASDMLETYSSDPYDLGDLTATYRILFAYAQFDGDEDRYILEVDDVEDSGVDEFFVEAYVDFVPATVDLSLTLSLLDGVQGKNMWLDTVNDEGAGGDEIVNFEGTMDVDESGTYELVVSAESGYDCAAPYTLTIGSAH